ncbi:hypothetical protein ACFSJW_15315 [Flavobacterium artemisiae]|uniref:Restriction endonuclease n=1 Tax=Flavobacterium artemisiae TaxID=2126556 RepID=A0ABW4HGY3_9FLAO
MDIKLLHQAREAWNNTLGLLSEEEKEALGEFRDQILMTDLHHLDFKKDAIEFTAIVRQLSKSSLYNQEIIPVIYNYYTDGDHHEMAYEYIRNAEKHLNIIKETILPKIRLLINDAFSAKLEGSLQNSFSNILSLPPDVLVRIVPGILNDKRVLSEFILNEFIQAARILKEKIDGLSEIKSEDKYNDLLLALLRLRLPVWGWEISDQARTGKSPTKKAAGEVDLTIKAGGNTIALFEALVLSKRNRIYTQKHVMKTTTYASFLDRYYMLIYYTGKTADFDKTWENYKNDASATSFAKQYKFNTVKGYEDLSAKFQNINTLKIAKSFHGKTEYFHLMIDLSR